MGRLSAGLRHSARVIFCSGGFFMYISYIMVKPSHNKRWVLLSMCPPGRARITVKAIICWRRSTRCYEISCFYLMKIAHLIPSRRLKITAPCSVAVPRWSSDPGACTSFSLCTASHPKAHHTGISRPAVTPVCHTLQDWSWLAVTTPHPASPWSHATSNTVSVCPSSTSKVAALPSRCHTLALPSAFVVASRQPPASPGANATLLTCETLTIHVAKFRQDSRQRRAALHLSPTLI